MIQIHRLAIPSYGAIPCYSLLLVSLCQFPLLIPSSLEPFYLLGIPPLVWCDPVHPGPRLLVNWPPSPHSFPIPFPFQIPDPLGLPQINCAPFLDDITIPASHIPEQYAWFLFKRKKFSVSNPDPANCSSRVWIHNTAPRVLYVRVTTETRPFAHYFFLIFFPASCFPIPVFPMALFHFFSNFFTFLRVFLVCFCLLNVPSPSN